MAEGKMVGKSLQLTVHPSGRPVVQVVLPVKLPDGSVLLAVEAEWMLTREEAVEWRAMLGGLVVPTNGRLPDAG